MKYSKEQRLDIGRQLYTGKLTKADAVEKYDISYASAKSYVTQYKRATGIPVKQNKSISASNLTTIPGADLELYQSMSKEELIAELILAKANELRAKKGYEVKGDGHKKEFIILNNKNSK